MPVDIRKGFMARREENYQLHRAEHHFRRTFPPSTTGTPGSSKYVTPLTTAMKVPQFNMVEDPRDNIKFLNGQGDLVVPTPQENDYRDEKRRDVSLKAATSTH